MEAGPSISIPKPWKSRRSGASFSDGKNGSVNGGTTYQTISLKTMLTGGGTIHDSGRRLLSSTSSAAIGKSSTDGSTDVHNSSTNASTKATDDSDQIVHGRSRRLRSTDDDYTSPSPAGADPVINTSSSPVIRHTSSTSAVNVNKLSLSSSQDRLSQLLSSVQSEVSSMVEIKEKFKRRSSKQSV